MSYKCVLRVITKRGQYLKRNESMNSYRILNDADTPSPLPLRVVPNPDEDLLSVLRRSASRMGYPDLRWILRPEGNKWSIEDTEIPLLSAKNDYEVLEHLLILSEEKLYSHTLHRFASLLEGVYGRQQPAEPVNPFTNLMRLSTVSQSTYFLPILSIRVCPICLQEQKCYDRLYWRLQLIFHCPQHRVCLLEKCPTCEAPITANRQSPYYCPRCQQGDYRTIGSMPLTPDNPLYVGELLLLKALGIALPVNEIASRSLASSPLSTLSGIS
jgi:TniQ/Zinc finger found in FPG and IleRS